METSKIRPIISVGQAMLIILQLFESGHLSQKSLNEPLNLKSDATAKDVSNEIKKLYVIGAYSEDSKRKIISLIKIPTIEKTYKVSLRDNVISNDPTRRYFESQLALQTLQNHLNDIQRVMYTTQWNSAVNYLKMFNPKDQAAIEAFLNTGEQDNKHFGDEFAFVIKNLLQPTESVFSEFDKNQRKNLLSIVKLTSLALICVSANNTNFPINIYGKGLFDPTNRGRIYKSQKDKNGNETSQFVRSNKFGIMKDIMPLSRNDTLFSDHAIPYNRPPENNAYVSSSLWPQLNFSTLVNPYVSSISGTFLILLRFFKELEEKNNFMFKDPDHFIKFTRLFCSTILLFGGGHSYLELLAVLKIPEVKSAFSESIPNEGINIEELVLLADNKSAVDEALKKTMKYNELIIKRDSVAVEYKQDERVEFLAMLADILEIAEKVQKPSTHMKQFMMVLNDLTRNTMVSTDLEEVSKTLQSALDDLKSSGTDRAFVANIEDSFNLIFENKQKKP